MLLSAKNFAGGEIWSLLTWPTWWNRIKLQMSQIANWGYKGDRYLFSGWWKQKFAPLTLASVHVNF